MLHKHWNIELNLHNNRQLDANNEYQKIILRFARFNKKQIHQQEEICNYNPQLARYGSRTRLEQGEGLFPPKPREPNREGLPLPKWQLMPNFDRNPQYRENIIQSIPIDYYEPCLNTHRERLFEGVQSQPTMTQSSKTKINLGPS